MRNSRFWIVAGCAFSACGAELSRQTHVPRAAPTEESSALAEESSALAASEIDDAPAETIEFQPDVHADNVLQLQPGGEVIGRIIGPLEQSAVGEPRDVAGETWWPVRPSVTGADQHGLVAWTRLNPESSPSESPAPTPPLRVATGHYASLETANGTVFARFWCNPIEVLREPSSEDPRAQVRVLFQDGSVALEGFIEGDVAEHGRRCGPRVVQHPMMTRGRVIATDGSVLDPGTPAPVVPDGYVRPSQVARFRLPRSVWIQGSPILESRRTCRRWRFRPAPDGGTLEHRVVVDQPERGAYATTTSHTLEGHPPEMRMYNRSWTVEILRRAPGGGMPRGNGAVGGLFDLTVVSNEADVITLVEGSRILAYHPDDALHWYRSAEACEATLPQLEPSAE